MTAKTFSELIEIETKPKRKSFFGKIFDSGEFAKKVSIHTLPSYKLFCGIERQDDKGLYIPELSRIWEGRSLLANWYNQLRTTSFAVDGNDGEDWDDGYINFKDTSNNVVSQNFPIVWITVNGYLIGVGTSALGIVLGTGSTAVTERDNKLATLILGGNTAGKINQGATTGNISYDSVNKIWQADYGRPFTGNAVDAVTVAEMGLDLNFYVTRIVMTARDLVSPTDTIGIAEARTYHYILQQINPA